MSALAHGEASGPLGSPPPRSEPAAGAGPAIAGDAGSRRRARTAWASPGPLRGASMLLASSLSVQMGAALATTLFATVTPAGAAAGSFAVAAALLLGLRRPRLAAWPAARWRDTTLLGLTMATSAGIIFSVEPAIAVLVGVIALDERLTFEGGLGVAAVVLAGFLALRDSGEAPTNP